VVVEIQRPSKSNRNLGWQVLKLRADEPVFREKDRAIGYAETRACFRKGEIRVLDSSGIIERMIAFNETDRRLG
jgi:hypothetical protein